ncbi:DUF2971 domain-containing protein [Aeromonas hydrophila]
MSPEFYSEESDIDGIRNFKVECFLSGCKSVVKDYIVPSDNFSKISLAVDVKYQVEQFNESIGVLCLTRDSHLAPKNSLMWAHYGESHSGIALKFNRDCQFVTDALPVNYVKSRPIINAKIFYDNAHVSIGDWFFKSSSWSYENEIRFTRHLDNCINTGLIDSFGHCIYVRKIEPEMLECVYVGANASADLRALALDFHSRTGVDVIYLGAGTKQYSLIPYSFNSRKSYSEIMDYILSLHKGSLELF